MNRFLERLDDIVRSRSLPLILPQARQPDDVRLSRSSAPRDDNPGDSKGRHRGTTFQDAFVEDPDECRIVFGRMARASHQGDLTRVQSRAASQAPSPLSGTSRRRGTGTAIFWAC